MMRFLRLARGTRRRRLITAGLLAGLLVALVAVIASGSGSATRAIFTAAASCTSESSQARVRVTIYSGEGHAPCEALDRGAARGAGAPWRLATAGAELEGRLSCSLQKGSTLMEVRHSGARAYADHICAALIAKRWHAHEGHGAMIERERAARAAVVQAASSSREAQLEAQLRQARDAARRERSARIELTHARAGHPARHLASGSGAASSARQQAERRHDLAVHKHDQALARQRAERRRSRHHQERAQEREEARGLQQESRELAREEAKLAAERRRSEREARHVQRSQPKG
jgi:hypothetical protein